MVFSRLLCENDVQYNAFEKLFLIPCPQSIAKIRMLHLKTAMGPFSCLSQSVRTVLLLLEESHYPETNQFPFTEHELTQIGHWGILWLSKSPQHEILCSKEMRGIKKERKNLWSPECQQITTVKYIKCSTLIFDQMSLYKVRTGSNGALKKITGPLRTQYMSV